MALMTLIYKSCSIYNILTWCCKALSICIETKSNHTHYSSTGQPTQVTNSSLIEVTVLRTQLHQMKWLTVKGLLSACHLHCYMSHSFSGFITLDRRWKRKTHKTEWFLGLCWPSHGFNPPCHCNTQHSTHIPCNTPHYCNIQHISIWLCLPS